MNLKKIVLSAVILLVLVLCFVLPRCTDFLPKSETKYVVYTDTIQGDSVAYPVKVTSYVPVVLYRDTGNVHWRDSPVDTLAILKDYFARLAYSDTAKNDSSALIVICDTVTENHIASRQVYFQNRRPIAINHTYVNPLKNKYLFGVMTGYNRDIELGPSFTFIGKRNQIINYGYNALKGEHSVRLFLPLIPRQRDPPVNIPP